MSLQLLVRGKMLYKQKLIYALFDFIKLMSENLEVAAFVFKIFILYFQGLNTVKKTERTA
jgi:hypothetical protein